MVEMSFAMLLLLAAADAQIFGPGGHFQLEQSKDGFAVRSHGIIEQLGSDQTKFYPLPQSTADEYIRLRAEDLRTNPFTPKQYERQEVIGSHQIENDRLWFGKQYYDSEGDRGVGAFGYFDASKRMYKLFSPPEVARYEISAILVQPDCVWLGLDQFVEDISKVPGGLVRWDRMTQAVQRYPLEFVVDKIHSEGDSLRLQTRGDYALFRGGTLHRFLADGRPIAKFPRPPTHN
jgi:hypothetical protein